jgi:hypothetical protein
MKIGLDHVQGAEQLVRAIEAQQLQIDLLWDRVAPEKNKSKPEGDTPEHESCASAGSAKVFPLDSAEASRKSKERDESDGGKNDETRDKRLRQNSFHAIDVLKKQHYDDVDVPASTYDRVKWGAYAFSAVDQSLLFASLFCGGATSPVGQLELIFHPIALTTLCYRIYATLDSECDDATTHLRMLFVSTGVLSSIERVLCEQAYIGGPVTFCVNVCGYAWYGGWVVATSRRVLRYELRTKRNHVKHANKLAQIALCQGVLFAKGVTQGLGMSSYERNDVTFRFSGSLPVLYVMLMGLNEVIQVDPKHMIALRVPPEHTLVSIPAYAYFCSSLVSYFYVEAGTASPNLLWVLRYASYVCIIAAMVLFGRVLSNRTAAQHRT